MFYIFSNIMLHFLLLAHSFTFVLNRYALQCFFDTIKQGKEASLGFQVSEGGILPLI